MMGKFASSRLLCVYFTVAILCVLLVFAGHGNAVGTPFAGPEIKITLPDAAVSDHFGIKVAIDGDTALIGADFDTVTKIGTAYIYKETSPGVWDQVSKLDADDGSAQDYYGSAVAISGSNCVVGAKYDTAKGISSGSAYIWSESSPGAWEQVTKLNGDDTSARDYSAFSVDISANHVVIGAYGDEDPAYSIYFNAGSVYIFSETTPGTWVQIAKLAASTLFLGGNFGRDLCLSASKLIVGSHGDSDTGNDSGAAYVYREVTTDNFNEVARLTGDDSAEYDQFGYAVGIDGPTIVVGAHWDDDFALNGGTAFIFSETAPDVWTYVMKIMPDSASSSDFFADQIAISGTTIIAGCYNDDDTFANAGSAYIFAETSSGVWTQVIKLVADDPDTEDLFGFSVDISGNNIIVGARNGNAGSILDTGAAYVYQLDTIDDCVAHMCENGMTCVDGLGEYSCKCNTVYNGTYCAECLCENGGVCNTDLDTGLGYCDCTGTNTVGYFCEIPCENGGIDLAISNWTTCDCTDVQYAGDLCTSSCNNGFGSAYPSTKCNCTGSGAEGSKCQNDIDDCESSPCAHGATCTDNGALTFPYHSHEFNCTCPEHYEGRLCENTMCVSSPCLHGGTCVNGEDFVCNCSNTGGYEGEFCQTDIDDCASSPCENQGTCVDLVGGYICLCSGTGFDGLTCTDDIDDCLSSPCMNDGTCKDKGVNNFKCTCTGTGFSGSLCQADVDDCSSSPCNNGGWCANGDTPHSYVCDCNMTGYTGALCEEDANDCASNPCLNNGTCADVGVHMFECECASGYTNTTCNVDVDDCASNPCFNDGTCTDVGTNAFECECPTTHSGEVCETLVVIDEPVDFDEPPTTIILFIPAFSNDTDQNEFVTELKQVLLPVALGGSPSDYDVTIVEQDGADGGYEVTIVTSNPSQRDAEEIERRIVNDVDINERIEGDVRIQVIEPLESSAYSVVMGLSSLTVVALLSAVVLLV